MNKMKKSLLVKLKILFACINFEVFVKPPAVLSDMLFMSSIFRLPRYSVEHGTR